MTEYFCFGEKVFTSERFLYKLIMVICQIISKSFGFFLCVKLKSCKVWKNKDFDVIDNKLFY